MHTIIVVNDSSVLLQPMHETYMYNYSGTSLKGRGQKHSPNLSVIKRFHCMLLSVTGPFGGLLGTLFVSTSGATTAQCMVLSALLPNIIVEACS